MTTNKGGAQFGLVSLLLGRPLPLRVHESGAGFYLGTWDNDGPFTRESIEYWRTRRDAEQALLERRWTQRLTL